MINLFTVSVSSHDGKRDKPNWGRFSVCACVSEDGHEKRINRPDQNFCEDRSRSEPVHGSKFRTWQSPR